MKTIKGNYFMGNEISEYGQKCGYVDYRTLAKCFDAVMNNDIIKNTDSLGYWEIENGNEFYYEDENGNEISYEEYEENGGSECYNEIFQYFIISANGAELLEEYTNEIVFYNETLDMYVWGVTHWGTSWDYILTDIKIEK